MSDGYSESMRGTYFSSNKYNFENDRISPENIENLKDNEIFVFGSNTKGIHGAGAAKLALKWGAKYGNGNGLQGKTYAIPTKDDNINTLSLDKIKIYVDEFIEFAKKNPNLIFLVTEIGCGLAGYLPNHIAPLFLKSKNIKNIYLPYKFLKIIKRL